MKGENMETYHAKATRPDHSGIYPRTAAASVICACGVNVPQNICNGIESDLVDTNAMLERALKIVGPPEGKIDLVGLVAGIAEAPLLRQALLKVREQREEARNGLAAAILWACNAEGGYTELSSKYYNWATARVDTLSDNLRFLDLLEAAIQERR